MDNLETSNQGIDTSNQGSPQEDHSRSSEGERLFRQSEVNEIVKKVKTGAVEDYKRMAAQRPDYAEQKFANSPGSQPFSPSVSQSDEHIRSLAAQELSRLKDEWQTQMQQQSLAQQAQGIVHEFLTKMATGKDKYEDFDSVTSDIEISKFPNTVHLVAGLDNTQDVMYELAKDRTKLALLEQLSNMSPRDAQRELSRLSQSIKDNDAAKAQRMPDAPLSQMKPSISGTDSGKLSIRDLRAKYRA